MANQMIALTGRPFQAPNLMGAAQQLGTFMTQRAQQKAAARQAEQAQLEMAAAQRKEQRDVAKDDIDLAGKQIDYHYKRATAVANPQGYAAWLAGVEKDSPEFAEFFRTNLPVEKFDRKELIRMVGSVKDNFDATYGPVTTEGIIGEKGGVGVLTRGGFEPPSLVKPPTYEQEDGQGGPLEAAPPVQEMTMGGQGGPLEAAPPVAPGERSARLSADLASPLLNVRDEASYQQALQMIGTVNPDAANQLRQIMPQFDPARMEGIRNEAFAAFRAVPQPSQGLVAGERGGMGGPFEGYVRSAEPFRARVPAPPVGPQPRETAEEVAAKRRAVLGVEREFELTAPPKKLTPAQEQKLRANIAEDKKVVDNTIVQMLDPKEGILGAIDGVRKLSKSQKEWLVGKTNYIPSFTDAGQTADTRWENLTGKATKMALAMARLGGSIGPMAVQEWSIVRNMIASLDPVKMSPQALEEQLDIIEATARGIAQRVKSAYENQYAEEFARYPGRFEIKNTPTSSSGRGRAGKNGGVDLNNPLLKGR